MLALSAVGFAGGDAASQAAYTAPAGHPRDVLGPGLQYPTDFGAGSRWDISPIVTAPWDFGSSTGIGTFYHYLPDLSIAQVIFLVGLTVVVMAALGLRRRRDRRWATARQFAAIACGGRAGGGVPRAAGTGRMSAQGMIAIPAFTMPPAMSRCGIARVQPASGPRMPQPGLCRLPAGSRLRPGARARRGCRPPRSALES